MNSVNHINSENADGKTILIETERNLFLQLARTAVIAAVTGKPQPEIPENDIFHRQGGAFVTLRKKTTGALMGCIGHFTGIDCLGNTIIEMAAAAALHDPRFHSLGKSELDDLRIEISLLSPMEKTEADKVIPGIHGLYIKSGPYSGTLLPQVAKEEGWDRESFLAHTCLKAGLYQDSWKQDSVEIYTYTADVFGER